MSRFAGGVALSDAALDVRPSSKLVGRGVDWGHLWICDEHRLRPLP